MGGNNSVLSVQFAKSEAAETVHRQSASSASRRLVEKEPSKETKLVSRVEKKIP